MKRICLITKTLLMKVRNLLVTLLIELTFLLIEKIMMTMMMRKRRLLRNRIETKLKRLKKSFSE